MPDEKTREECIKKLIMYWLHKNKIRKVKQLRKFVNGFVNFDKLYAKLVRKIRTLDNYLAFSHFEERNGN